ncbi:BCCT family transporter [Corynebacterium urealyticum]|uniref:BCCT family transporter n=1 Tax=Corynebacterium urealyticum TaxID=43771 RepID=UPI0011E723EF|nr:BCCT family transporter [Corynebacterium urealyticum]TYR15590.1 BCCT family transporter [Corynebacterium urealyticum]
MSKSENTLDQLKEGSISPDEAQDAARLSEPADSAAAKDERAGIDWVVTGTAAALVLAVVAWGLVGSESFANFASQALDYVVVDWGWLFVLASTVFVFFVLFVAFSKFGHIKLGKDGEQPEFSTFSWVAMMFAAGMGIGLMFYGTTEPLTFFRDGVPGRAEGNVGEAFASTLFHWGLHPWSLYAIVGLAIAFGTFRLGRKQLLSSAFIPLIGHRLAEGWLGKLIDILAIFATVFGTAASLGIGARQISSGMEIVNWVDSPGNALIVGIIIVLGIAFLISAASGVGKGIQWISNTNMVLASIIALFVLIVGPTVVIMNMVPTTLGSYLQDFFAMASRTAQSSEDAGDWLSAWTIFYWAWWVSWSPFVGMFLARISRGRTVREFIMVILLVPTSVTILWFSIFGGTAIHLEETGKSIWGDGDATKMLFNLLHEYPFGAGVSIIAMLLLATFFITSADSASTVMGSMSQRGRLVASPIVTVLWGVLTCAIAVIMLTTGDADSLDNLQSITIIAASPFVLIIIALMFAVVKALGDDPLYLDQKNQRKMVLRVAREYRERENRELVKRALRMKNRREEGAAATAAAVPDAPATAEAEAAVEDSSDAHSYAAEDLDGLETMSVYDGDKVVEVVDAEDVADYINNRNDENGDGRS